MAEYSTSQATRRAFIMAAGSLFAEKSVDKVGLREIAARAGENMGNIHYHFGGKDGLLRAVIDFVLEPLNNDIYGQYIRAREELFNTSEGQAQLVGGLIDFYVKNIFSGDRPLWCGILVSNVIEQNLPRYEGVFDEAVGHFLETFGMIYRRIKGERCYEDIIAWIMTVVTPATVLARDMCLARKIDTLGVKEELLWKKMRDMIIRGALANLGLAAYIDEVMKRIE